MNNKKIIYLTSFLILALFLVSSCDQAVGDLEKGVRDLHVRKLTAKQVTVSGETNTNSLSTFSLDVIAPNPNPSKIGGRVNIQDGIMSFGMQGIGGNFVFDGDLYTTESLHSKGSASFEDKQIELNEGTLQLHQLSGDGNAYACLDKNGILFRNDEPCK